MLLLNVHFHTLVLDGVYAADEGRRIRFYRLRIYRLTASFPTLTQVNGRYYLREMVDDGALGVFTPGRVFSQRAADLKALLSWSSGRALKICTMATET